MNKARLVTQYSWIRVQPVASQADGWRIEMTKLTTLVQDHITRLFSLEERTEVTRLLQEDCDVGPGNASLEFLERIHCAVLKCSEGQMENLHGAIALAQTDWRDLLVSAGFAERPDTHKDWKG